MPAKPKAAATAPPRAASIADLQKDLFQAAVNLRGSIEPADYKRYVLPLIFLRFLSLRFTKRRGELEHFVLREKGSELFGDKAALTDPDEYRRVGAFIVPEQAQWSYLLAHAADDDIRVKVDEALQLLEDTYPTQLKGLLPRIFAGSNLSSASLKGLIDLFSRDIFTLEHGGEDLIGRIYEYFIGEFANSEGKRGGEFFTPASIVKTLVAMLEPTRGRVFDPCCGSGGMFVQSDVFAHHNTDLFYCGQEAKDFTYRLCRMNLFLHGLEGDIRLGSSYTNDQFSGAKKFDYILANPPFNDGSKGDEGWGAKNITDKDPRLSLGPEKLPLSPRNANTLWMLHFVHHLSEAGTAGFVMATGELSNSEISRLAVRRALVEQGYVDCIVTLTGQLFANTQIPCALWFLSKTRAGRPGPDGVMQRKRKDHILFIDARKLGVLIPGSRKQKQLSEAEIERIARAYNQFRHDGKVEPQPGFCATATLDQVREHSYALTPGRYVGAEEGLDDDEPFEDKFPKLVSKLEGLFGGGAKLAKTITTQLKSLSDES